MFPDPRQAQFFIFIDGQVAPAELQAAISEVIVDDSLHLPDLFSIYIHDPELKWIDSDLLNVGKEIEIQVYITHPLTLVSSNSTLIIGEITALAPQFRSSGEQVLQVRGYTRAHRLMRGKKNRSFLRTTDSEVAQRIARENRLQAQVTPTAVVHDYIFQDNQTDLEFLQNRAQRCGFQVYVKENTLFFGQPEEQPEEGLALLWGNELREFEPRLTTSQQVDEVLVRGWDPRTKQPILGRVNTSQAGPQIGLDKNGSQVAAEAFRLPAQFLVVDSPVSSIDEANALAQALFDEIRSDFIQAEGLAFGNPRLKAGQDLTILGVGKRFSGTYFITSVTHTLSREGYLSRFNISGRKPETLTSLLRDDHPSHQGWGMVVGLVTNNRDPQNLGRVKVKLPWLSDSDESTWARLAAPMGGNGRGFFYLPEINDEVLLGFEHGSINHPYILGVLWNGKDLPPLRNDQVIGKDGKVNQHILRSRSGLEITLDDTPGAEKITLRDASGKTKLVLDAATKGLEIKAEMNLTIQCEGELSLKGKTIRIDGTTKVDVKGGTINLN